MLLEVAFLTLNSEVTISTEVTNVFNPPFVLMIVPNLLRIKKLLLPPSFDCVSFTFLDTIEIHFFFSFGIQLQLQLVNTIQKYLYN